MVENKGRNDVRELFFCWEGRNKVYPQLTRITRKGKQLITKAGHGVKQDPSKEELMSFRAGGSVRGVA